jgi:hypothetical protein
MRRLAAERKNIKPWCQKRGKRDACADEDGRQAEIRHHDAGKPAHKIGGRAQIGIRRDDEDGIHACREDGIYGDPCKHDREPGDAGPR